MTQDDDELDDNDLHIAVRLGDVEATKLALKQGTVYCHQLFIIFECMMYNCKNSFSVENTFSSTFFVAVFFLI